MGLERINEFKKEQGLTNLQLSSISGIPLSTIDKITAGITLDPKLETVRAIAKALGKTLDDFDDELQIVSKDSLFGEQLKKARKNKKYTLEELADKYNEEFDGCVNKGTLSKYENGRQEPMITVVRNLSKILDVTVDFLLFGKQEQKQSKGEVQEAYDKATPKEQQIVRTVLDISEPKIHEFILAAKDGDNKTLKLTDDELTNLLTALDQPNKNDGLY